LDANGRTKPVRHNLYWRLWKNRTRKLEDFLEGKVNAVLVVVVAVAAASAKLRVRQCM
jgi:hypothetical protein